MTQLSIHFGQKGGFDYKMSAQLLRSFFFHVTLPVSQYLSFPTQVKRTYSIKETRVVESMIDNGAQDQPESESRKGELAYGTWTV